MEEDEKPAKRPVDLYIVTRLLLAGASYREISSMTGWSHDRIRHAAADAGYRLPSVREIAIGADPLLSSLVETTARQGFSQHAAQRLLHFPSRVIRRFWPAGVPDTGDVSDALELAKAMITSGAANDDIVRATGLSRGRVLRLRQEMA